jgi:hypothetical protein
MRTSQSIQSFLVAPRCSFRAECTCRLSAGSKGMPRRLTFHICIRHEQSTRDSCPSQTSKRILFTTPNINSFGHGEPCSRSAQVPRHTMPLRAGREKSHVTCKSMRVLPSSTVRLRSVGCTMMRHAITRTHPQCRPIRLKYRDAFEAARQFKNGDSASR